MNRLFPKLRRGYHTMTVKFLIPKELTSIHDGKVVQISAGLNHRVERGQHIVSIETWKCVLEETALVTGILTHIHVKQNQEIREGEPLYTIEYL